MLSPVKIWRRQKKIREMLGKKGKVLTYTRVNVPPSDFKKYAPYYVVIVEFEDGKRAVGQIVDLVDKKMKMGLKVESILRKVREVSNEDIIAYGLKFRPL